MSGIMAAASGAGYVPITVTCSDIWGNGGTTTITTNPADGNATGGTGSFTYLWSFAGGTSFNVISPTSPFTQFRALGMGPGDERDAQYTLTATDTVTGQTGSITVNVVATRDF